MEFFDDRRNLVQEVENLDKRVFWNVLAKFENESERFRFLAALSKGANDVQSPMRNRQVPNADVKVPRL